MLARLGLLLPLHADITETRARKSPVCWSSEALLRSFVFSSRMACYEWRMLLVCLCLSPHNLGTIGGVVVGTTLLLRGILSIFLLRTYCSWEAQSSCQTWKRTYYLWRLSVIWEVFFRDVQASSTLQLAHQQPLPTSGGFPSSIYIHILGGRHGHALSVDQATECRRRSCAVLEDFHKGRLKILAVFHSKGALRPNTSRSTLFLRMARQTDSLTKKEQRTFWISESSTLPDKWQPPLGVSNPWPPTCWAGALPTELRGSTHDKPFFHVWANFQVGCGLTPICVEGGMRASSPGYIQGVNLKIDPLFAQLSVRLTPK